MDTRPHHPYGPSTLAVKARCPAFESLPNPSGGAAAVGTALHELVEEVLRHAAGARVSPVIAAREVLGPITSTLEREDLRAVLFVLGALDLIMSPEVEGPYTIAPNVDLIEYNFSQGFRALTATAPDDRWARAQFEVRLPIVLEKRQAIFGYVDFLAPHPSGQDVGHPVWVLGDYKFGAVDVALDTLQLQLYACGAFQIFKEPWLIRAFIIQPTRQKVVCRKFFRTQLATYLKEAYDVLQHVRAYERSGDLDAFASSGKQCAYCNKLPVCSKGAEFMRLWRSQSFLDEPSE